jgi:hypothetical protein
MKAEDIRYWRERGVSERLADERARRKLETRTDIGFRFEEKS